MKFAHFTQTLPRPGETAVDRYDQLWRELELADEVNFDFGFASVHHFSRLRPTSTIYCTGAAARTRRLRLGPMGYSVALYDPIRIVEEVALLDSITHGRLEVGLTIGVTPEEFRIYRGDWENRHAIATEAMFLLRKAFTSEKSFRLRRPVPPVQSSPAMRRTGTAPAPADLANISKSGAIEIGSPGRRSHRLCVFSAPPGCGPSRKRLPTDVAGERTPI